MKVIAIVPARCGSKGFPHKNIAKINDKTLLELAVKVGIDCAIVDDVYISTDCYEYEKIALNAGAKSIGLRPKELATDTAKSIDAIVYLLENIDKVYDYVVLLQPTSPLRAPIDIEQMIKNIEHEKADASVSIVKLEEPHPYKLKSIDNGYIEPFIKGTDSELPRQSLPKAYALNGALYGIKMDTLLNTKTFLPKKTIPYVMDNLINVDTEEDFLFLKMMQKEHKISIYGVNDGQ